jgi:hypothetical protein
LSEDALILLLKHIAGKKPLQLSSFRETYLVAHFVEDVWWNLATVRELCVDTGFLAVVVEEKPIMVALRFLDKTF